MGTEHLSQESPKQKLGMPRGQPGTILSLMFPKAHADESQPLPHCLLGHPHFGTFLRKHRVLVFLLYLFLAVVLVTCVSSYFSITWGSEIRSSLSFSIAPPLLNSTLPQPVQTHLVGGKKLICEDKGQPKSQQSWKIICQCPPPCVTHVLSLHTYTHTHILTHY